MLGVFWDVLLNFVCDVVLLWLMHHAHADDAAIAWLFLPDPAYWGLSW